MEKLGKYLLCILIIAQISSNCFAQNEAPIQFGADLMSRYVWRGVDLGGESPSIQPYIEGAWSSKNTFHLFAIGAWGAYNFNTLNQEVDLYFTYTFKDVVSITFTDYYFPGLYSSTEPAAKFFIYKKETTGHVLEPSISFNGTEKIPFTLLFAMNVYGADARKINDDGTSGAIFMSKYVEVGFTKTIKDVDFNAFVGAALDDPDENKADQSGNPELGYYGLNTSAGIVNLGIKVSKSIKITEYFELPVQASIITNPEAEKIYIVFGISF